MQGEDKYRARNILAGITKNSTVLTGVVLILLIAVAAAFSPYFLSIFNLQSLMRDIAFIGIIATGQSLLLLIGELDLSVGRIATLSGILGGLLMTQISLNPVLAFLIGALSGILLGCINGLLITKLKITAMVATIGMQGVYGGITMVITKGQAITGIPESILFVGKNNFLGMPIPFVIAVLILIAVVLFVVRTKTGRYIYAIGNSREAAKIMGIRVDRIRLLIYGIVGLLSSTAGMLYVARLGSAQAAIGTNWPMNSIAACVIGGVLLTGGVGNPVGSFLGAAIICVISNVIVLFGVNIYWQEAVSGIVVVVAIGLPSFVGILREKKKLRRSRD